VYYGLAQTESGLLGFLGRLTLACLRIRVGARHIRVR
jgi:hypothetical protein